MLARTARPALRAAATAVPSRPVNSAGYATIREIEGRLKSIRNMRKITNTMKVVASTKLSRAQRAMTESRSYGEASNAVYGSAETKALEADPAAGKKSLLILCSSDSGLCGGIHSGISRYVRRLLADKPHHDLVIVGEKCKSQMSRTHPEKIVMSFSGVRKDVPTFGDAQAVADQISQLESDYVDIKIIHNKFFNAQSYEPVAAEVFNEEAILQSPNLSAFEVDGEQVPNLKEYGLANSLYWAFAEGYACEVSAKRNAMDNATKNAGEMINRYQILYNRTRQAVITGELVEIITGATASEDM